MASLSNTQIINALKIANIATMGVTAGFSYSMSLFMIPMILKANSAKTMTVQFNEMVGKGGTYLQPAGRTMAVSISLLTYLLYKSEDKSLAGKWKYWAAAVGVLAQFAWYEVVAIFPTNHRVADLAAALEKKTDGSDEEEKGLMRAYLKVWHRRNLVRASFVMTAALLGLWSVA